jgi:ABC-type enterochelin transport system substrate-binding protein
VHTVPGDDLAINIERGVVNPSAIWLQRAKELQRLTPGKTFQAAWDEVRQSHPELVVASQKYQEKLNRSAAEKKADKKAEETPKELPPV